MYVQKNSPPVAAPPPAFERAMFWASWWPYVLGVRFDRRAAHHARRAWARVAKLLPLPVAVTLACMLASCAAPVCSLDAAVSDVGPPVRASQCDELDAFASGLGCPVFCPWVAPCGDVAPCMELLRLQAESCTNLAAALSDDLCRVCR
jgi:hypothetical protein